MKEMLIGRKGETALLEKVKNTQKSAFVAVYGRRRVGKTFLIRKTLENQFTFQVTGIANATLKHQLLKFRNYLALSRTLVNAAKMSVIGIFKGSPFMSINRSIIHKGIDNP